MGRCAARQSLLTDALRDRVLVLVIGVSAIQMHVETFREPLRGAEFPTYSFIHSANDARRANCDPAEAGNYRS